ncbi:ABC transporter permease [Deinococcus lacus]|uniref:ABC transporter permease n=1 Tax=Deinococcus lacus TaxID=392561 RepID=A0ABW1YD74_9DEIO
MFLGLKELKYNWLRSALLGGIAALLAFMVFMLLGLTRGLSQDSAAWLLESPAQTFLTTQDSQGNFTRSFIGPAAVKAVQEKWPQAAPFAQSFVSFSVNQPQGPQLGGVLLGVEPGSLLAPAAVAGSSLGPGGVVADISLQEDGVQLGDTLILKPGGERLRVTGFTQSARLNHQPAVFVSLADWQKLSPRAAGTVSGLGLPEADVPPLAGLRAQSRAGALQALQGYKEEQGSLLMIQVFLVAVSALVMAVFFYVMTLQKTAQFGLLKALGARLSTLAGSVIVQVLTLSLLATVVAAAATYGVTQVLPDGIPFALSWGRLRRVLPCCWPCRCWAACSA